MDIQKELDTLLAFEDKGEQMEHEAQMLAFQFLSLVDAYMAENKILKKELAGKIGTSAAFITQLFRGDRKPSWSILAKMQNALQLDFKVYTQHQLNQLIRDELTAYHHKWVKMKSYEEKNGMEPSRAIMAIAEGPDYALAG